MRVPITNWGGNVVYGAARVHQPDSVEELRRIVGSTRRVRALGSGHSFSRIADTTHDLVRLDALPPTVEIDTARLTATVGAGMCYGDVAAELQRAGLALANLASLPHISVGGSCATGTHGSGDTQRCLAASVAGLQLVGPGGDLTELSRDADRDTFSGSVVALGALGIVTRLTLDVEPTFQVAQRVQLAVPLDEVASRFDEILGAAYSVSVFTDWARGEAAVWLKSRIDQPAPDWAGGTPAGHAVHPVPGMPPQVCTEQLGLAGPWHERLPHFRAELPLAAARELQSEFYLPREVASDAITAMRDIGGRLAPAVHIVEIRTVRADDLWLSPAYGRDTVTVHFTWVDDAAAVMPVLGAVEERLMAMDARPHWGKLTTADPQDIITRYERANQFGQLMLEYDPDGKFRNAFVDSLFPGLVKRL